MNMNDLKNRIKSLLWRTGGVVLAAGLSFLASNLSDLQLSPEVTVFIGLIIGEITKQLNKQDNG